MNATAAASEGGKQPLPLRLGLYFGLVVTLVFLNGYKLLGKPTTKGWLATLSVAFEVYGVLLIASPELRPIAARLGAACTAAARRVVRKVGFQLRRLFRLPAPQRASLGGAVSATSGLGIDVKRGWADPPNNATVEEKVEFLLSQVKRLVGLVESLENLVRIEMAAVRGELGKATEQLKEHTALAVRELADAELRMRLLGVVFVLAGIAFGYAANLV